MSSVRHTLRAVTLADVEPVAQLLREAGGLKVRSEAGWRWLFQENPAHRRQDPPPPMGWVLECDGALQGYLGNVHLDYVLDGQPLRAATCTSYYVRASARAESTRLMSAFFRQPDVDLFLSTTANAASDPVYRLYKAAVPQDASFGEGLVWVVNDRLAIEDALTRRGVSRSMTRMLAGAASPAARLLRGMTGFATAPRGNGYDDVLTVAPEEIDERFDHLWNSLSTAPGLRVRRDAARLRWYFSDPDAGSVPKIFAAADTDGLVGYAAAAVHRPPDTPTAQLRILDVVVRDGNEPAVPALLRRLVAHAREAGAGLVYCVPCGASLAAQLKALRPYAHRHEHAAHFLRAAKQIAGVDLTRPGIWQATGLDGDTPFCIERC